MDWVGFALILLGNLLVGNKKKSGFASIAVGSIIWVIIAFQNIMYALALVNITGTILMVRNWRKWKVEEKYWQSMILPEYRIKWWQIWK